jgi:hypothetical protein
MNNETWLPVAKLCVEQIYAYDYFVSVWERVKHSQPLEDCSKEQLLKPFQDMWEAVPDTAHIRRVPFNLICNLAEEYVFGEDCADKG